MITSRFLDPLYRNSGGISRKQELDFTLPPELEAHMPPEARGLARDEVRLMVSYRSDDRVVHTRFRQIGDFLQAGDLLVINTSGTMKAALTARRENGMPVELHLSTHLPADLWLVEVRTQGEKLRLAEGASAILHVPYRHQEHMQGRNRLWIATLHLPDALQEYLARNGFPIRYSYVPQEWPIDYYQSVYVSEVGSAEMPSAGRAFTTELITSLIAHGVQVAPLLLHTGVASLEDHEPPYEEYYRVPPETARIVNATRTAGKRIVAVGTTVIRALETVTDAAGVTHAGEGWTNIVITPERSIRAVNSLLTGLHEPQATHLFMLEALASVAHLRKTYLEAIEKGYLWHEFGDLHLILP